MPSLIRCAAGEHYVDRTEIAEWVDDGDVCVDCAEPMWERCDCGRLTTNSDEDHNECCRFHGGRGGEDKDQWEAEQ